MKKNLYSLIGITLFLCLCFSSKANFTGDEHLEKATWQRKVCFTDGFGFVWNVTVSSSETKNFYTCSGTVNVDGVIWDAYGSGIFPDRDGSVLLHAINPNPDGCNLFSDSFVYNGTASVTGSGSTLAYIGTGVWVSYCGGSIINSGEWSAGGPCAGSLKSNYKGIKPAAGKNAFKISISPNPLKSSSTLTFNLAKESKVVITVYNSKLQPVKQILNKTESAGKHSYVIDGSFLTNGIYRVVTVINGKPYSSALQVVK